MYMCVSARVCKRVSRGNEGEEEGERGKERERERVRSKGEESKTIGKWTS